MKPTIRAVPRIVLKGVSKSFAGADGKSVTAVDCLTLAVENREMLAIVGPSGCGKTTTLRLIAGLESPDAGDVRFDDVNVTALRPVNRDVAMVFQSHALFPHLSAFDNIAFGLRLRHVSKVEIAPRVREMSELLGLGHCLDRKPGKLSGGERQRVALGRALVRRPKILLLDEPFSHLDAPLRAQLQAELLALRARLEMTVIYVTHDQAEALALGDRVAVLQRGKLQQIGEPREIHETPANTFVGGFIGSPPMNLFHGTIARRESGLVLVGVETDATAPAFLFPLGDGRADWFSQNVGRQILLALRPEWINLANDHGQAANTTVVAVVQSLQYLGAETRLHLRVGGTSITARLGSHCTCRPGQTVGLAFDLSRARVYDAVTGQALF